MFSTDLVSKYSLCFPIPAIANRPPKGRVLSAAAESLDGMRQQVLKDIIGLVADAKSLEASALAAKWGVPPIHVRRLVKKGQLYEPILNLLFQAFNPREIADRLETSPREIEQVIQYVEGLLAARYRQ